MILGLSKIRRDERCHANTQLFENCSPITDYKVPKSWR